MSDEIWVSVEGQLRKIPYGLLPDWAIARYIGIDPLAKNDKRPGKISYGISSYGYDARLGRRFKVFDPTHGDAIVDPKNIDERIHSHREGDYCIIPPNSYILGETLETFHIPRDVTALCVGKSTYARCAVAANVTPLEAEWTGQVTVEISNQSPLPVKVYAGEGIMQILFFRAEGRCDVSYADKKGIYQAQEGLTLSRIRQ